MIGESSGGRKPVIVEFLTSARYPLGVRITKDDVRIILTNLKFHIIISERCFELEDNIVDFYSIIKRINDDIKSIFLETNRKVIFLMSTNYAYFFTFF